MRRAENLKVKQEEPAASSSVYNNTERDLSYYIHDRVELMHQVFSVLKSKELKAMAPSCVQYISISDLQELCTEELLGISSKRLCAILDGAEPPSDTESSSPSPSPEKLETISLDSISSDEEILSENSNKKKKHKHRRHAAKSKSKHKRKPSTDDSENNEDRSKASRAGLTVLELLELQARARAIRAQLQQEQTADATDVAAASAADKASDDEVEIKEEPPEVVEISSEDEKPNIEDLQKGQQQTSKISIESTNPQAQTVIRRINDLVITVPQSKPTRKIKLNRNKAPATITNISERNSAISTPTTTPLTIEITNKEVTKDTNSFKSKDKTQETTISRAENTYKKSQTAEITDAAKEKPKKKQKKKGKDKSKIKEGSDHDEITLQLSDSEKMDLLEDLDRKNYDNVSSSCTEDSEGSSESSGDDEESTEFTSTNKNSEVPIIVPDKKDTNTDVTDAQTIKNNKNTKDKHNKNITTNTLEGSENKDEEESLKSINKNINVKHNKNITNTTLEGTETIDDECLKSSNTENKLDDAEEMLSESQSINDIQVTALEAVPITNDNAANLQDLSENLKNSTITEKCDKQNEEATPNEPEIICATVQNIDKEKTEVECVVRKINKELSEGEITDHESSVIEASDLKPEVVCISDEEDNKKSHKKKKNKKKEKKTKKEKRSKKSPDFRNGADENFYRESETSDPKVETSDELTNSVNMNTTNNAEMYNDDKVFEILELSDDSSGNEEEGTSVLSKEPTAAEIEALSAKIDEIEREDVVTVEEIRAHERLQVEEQTKEIVENWRDRYLESKKVKNVLSTSNILNALRKKNKELKRKLEESKTVPSPAVVTDAEDTAIKTNLEEGSIEHYNALEGSTKYVDPVIVENEIQGNAENEQDAAKEGNVTKEMKKDAKQLLKMYKKLLKYNDINRPQDPHKKKRKKSKKNKEDKEKIETVTSEMNCTTLV